MATKPVLFTLDDEPEAAARLGGELAVRLDGVARGELVGRVDSLVGQREGAAEADGLGIRRAA